MAQPQIPSRPLQDIFPGPPPPYQEVFHMNVPQPSPSARNLAESRAQHQHRVSGDYSNNCIPMAGFPGDGALPVPTGPQAHLGNGGLRSRDHIGGGGVFEGARSPPGTKSALQLEETYTEE